jgi:hypothetical protein
MASMGLQQTHRAFFARRHAYRRCNKRQPTYAKAA